MIENIKIAQKCNGSFNKKMHLLEKKYGRKKGIYYLKNFKKQHLVTFKDICVKNFKQGIQAKKIELIINRKLLKNVKKNEPVKKGDFFNEKKNKLKKGLLLLDKIQWIRSKNNKNWMDVLRLSLKLDFNETVKIIKDINNDDRRISKLAKKLYKLK